MIGGILKAIDFARAVKDAPKYLKAAAIQKAREVSGIEALSDKFESYLAKREYETYQRKRAVQEKINKMMGVKEPDVLKFKKTYTTDEEKKAAADRRAKEEQNRLDRLNGIDPRKKAKEKPSETTSTAKEEIKSTESKTPEDSDISVIKTSPVNFSGINIPEEKVKIKSTIKESKNKTIFKNKRPGQKPQTIIVSYRSKSTKESKSSPEVFEAIKLNLENMGIISQKFGIDVSGARSLLELNSSINSSLIKIADLSIDEQDTSIDKVQAVKNTSGIITKEKTIQDIGKTPGLMDLVMKWGGSLLESIFGISAIKSIKEIGLLKWVGKSIGEVFEVIMKPFKDFFANIGKTVTELLETALKPLKDMMNEMWSYVDDLIMKVGSFVGLTKNVKLAEEIGSITASSTKVSSAVSGVAAEAGEVAAKAVSAEVSAATKVAGAGAGVAAAEGTGKAAGAAAGKAAGKLLPGVGLGLSLFFGAKRLMDGDFVGAGMELASGVAGLFPGVGTAVAIGLQGALIAKDAGAFDVKRTDEVDQNYNEGSYMPDIKTQGPSTPRSSAASSSNPNAFNEPSSPVSVSGKDVPGATGSVKEALENASKITGVPLDIVNKIAYIESGYNPKSDSGVAKGLMQITKATWTDLANRYGKEHGILPSDDPFDMTKNAILGAYYIKQLMSGIGSIVKSPTATDVYMTYFLGPGGGKKFLQNMIKNGDAPAATDFVRESASNKAVFFDKSGRARSYKEIYAMYASKLGGTSPVPSDVAQKTSPDGTDIAKVETKSDLPAAADYKIIRGTGALADPFEASFNARRNESDIETSKKKRDDVIDKVLQNTSSGDDAFSKQREQRAKQSKMPDSTKTSGGIESKGSINRSEPTKKKEMSSAVINSSFPNNYFTLDMLSKR